MRFRLEMLSGSGLMAGGELVNNVCLLLRNVILARILSQQDFGIAATLGLVVAMFELSGKMCFGQHIIQSTAGDDADFQSASQASQALGGILSGLLILVFSDLMARCFGMGSHRTAFMLLAVIPLCNGFSSLEAYRMVRHLRFVPIVLTETVPQILITLATWPLACWLQDYRALLCLLVAKALLSLITSQLVGQRPYRLSWHPRLTAENLRFGWPLLVTSFLIVGVFQGDRMLVAGTYTLSELGVYAAASTLAMAPALGILKICGSIALPVLARAQAVPTIFEVYYSLYAQILAVLAAVVAVSVILGGDTVIRLCLGPKYDEAGALAAWLTLGQSVRILRGAAAGAALAKGDTVNTMMSNLWRLSGLILAVPIVLLKLDLRWVAIAGMVGELVALSAALARLRVVQDLSPSAVLYPGILMAGLALGAYVAGRAFAPSHVASTLVLIVAGCAVTVMVFLLVFVDLRKLSISLIVDVTPRVATIVRRFRLGRAHSRA